MKRIARLASVYLLITAMLLFLGDEAVLQVRIRRGTGYRVVEVNQFLVTPLKGQKDEYDFSGTIQVTCARSIFPQPGTPACWWLERHRDQWQ